MNASSTASSTTGARSRSKRIDFLTALRDNPPPDITRLYWLARVTLVTRLEDMPAFDAVFATHFAGAPPTVEPRRGGRERGAAAQATSGELQPVAARRGHRQGARASTTCATAAPTTPTADDLRRAAQGARASTCRTIRSRRRRPAPPRPRSTCAARCAPRPAPARSPTLARRDRPHRTRPLLVLIDVSGSLRPQVARLPALRLGRAGRDVHVRHAADADHQAAARRATSTPRWPTSPRPSRTPTAAPASAPRCRSSSTRRATPTAPAAR